MPRGKKPSKKQSGSRKTAPLSSLALATATEETLTQLSDAGLSSFRGTESEALALLALKKGDNESSYAPRCYRKEYNPTTTLCAGCVFWASCWQGDTRYLRSLRIGEVYPPPHVPTGVIDKVVAKVKRRVSPPKPRKKG